VNHRRLKTAIAFSLALCASTLALVLGFQLPGASVELLFTGSLNGNLDGCDCFGYPTAGLVKLAAALRGRDRTRTILLDAGDLFESGSDKPLADELRGTVAELGYDLVAIGDQEFSNGAEYLMAANASFASGSDSASAAGPWDVFPAFGSLNLAWDGHPLGSGFRSLDRGGLHVLVMSVTGPESFALFPADFTSRLTVLDPVEAAIAVLAADRASGPPPYDLVVALYHGDPEKAGILQRAIEATSPQAQALVITSHFGELMPVPRDGRKDRLALIDLPRKDRVERLDPQARTFSPAADGNRIGRIVVSKPLFARFGLPFRAHVRSAEYAVLNYLNDPDDLPTRQRVLRYYLAFTELTGIEKDFEISLGSGNGTSSMGDAPLELEYFYSPNCPDCVEFMNASLPEAARQAGRSLKVKKRNIMRPEDFEALHAILAERGLAFRGVPVLVGEGGVLQGEDAIEEGLDALVNSTGLGGAGSVAISTNRGKGYMPELPAFFPVIAAGLLDGINPCAFSTVVFLLSSLALAGARGPALAAMGLAFCGGVFGAYFAVGLGAFAALRGGHAFPLLSVILRWGMAALLCAGSVLSLLDARRAHRGETGAMILQLPAAAKLRIHSLVRSHRKGGGAVFGAFFLGAAVSVLELGCTGQIYLPTLVYLARTQGGFSDIALLALYNFAFIVPLLAVFLLAASGLSSRKIAAFFGQRVFAVKIATAFLFVVLAALMLAPQNLQASIFR
jgi:cytochrome c biogenesis protein CcdA